MVRSNMTSLFNCCLCQLLLLCTTEAVRIVPSTIEELQENQYEEVITIQGQEQNHRKLQRTTKRLRSLLEEKKSEQEEEPKMIVPDDHRVENLPLLLDVEDNDKILLFAGHLLASPDHKRKLFYWLVGPPQEMRGDPNVPLLIWLNGGPGCSSSEGFFLENGPYKFMLVDTSNGDPQGKEQKEWKLVPNPHSWHLAPAWVLYVDQPVGTGLSFTTDGHYCTTDEEVDRDFVYFLEEFLLLHGQVFLTEDGKGGPPQLNRPLYFSGESHAGHYIPSMMNYILNRQAQKAPHRVDIEVRGAAIGNGWIDPYHQYGVSTIAYGAGLLNLAQKEHMDALEIQCQRTLEQGNLRPKVCFDLLELVRDQSHGGTSGTTVSQYDYRVTLPRGGSSQYPPGDKLIDCYLGGRQKPTVGRWNTNLQNVLEAIHAKESLEANQHYLGCTNAPYQALAYQDGLGVVPQLKNILEHPGKIRLLFYNGMNDLICNHFGNELLLQKLPWKNSEKWVVAPRFAWHLQDQSTTSSSIVAGYVQEYENLTFLKIPHSGHMVPMDQPEISLQMISTFLHESSFQTSQQRLESDPPSRTSCKEETE